MLLATVFWMVVAMMLQMEMTMVLTMVLQMVLAMLLALVSVGGKKYWEKGQVAGLLLSESRLAQGGLILLRHCYRAGRTVAGLL